MRARYVPGFVALRVVRAMRRQDHAVCYPFDQLWTAAIQRLQDLWRWADAQRAPRYLEDGIDAPVDRPPPRCVDEAAPIDEPASALKIQGDVIEPRQPPEAVREQKQLAPILAIDQ